MPMSTYLSNTIIDATVRNTTYTSPATVYVALYSDVDAGTELSGNGYSRQSVTFAAPTAGATESASTVTFTASGGNWLGVLSIAITDASSGGNVLWYKNIVNQNVKDGESLGLDTGAITLRVS